MEPYRVGALADLISSASKIKAENGEKKKGKKKNSLENLFTSRLPPAPAPEPIKQEVISKVKKEVVADTKSPKSAKKRKSGKFAENGGTDENKTPKKKSKRNGNEDSSDDEGVKEYDHPSLRFQVIILSQFIEFCCSD